MPETGTRGIAEFSPDTRIENAEMPKSAATGVYNGEVVISGISCRFPESDNMQEFRDNLMNGIDMVTEDNRRWEPGLYGLPKRNGKLKDLSKFDADFFGVHPKQAKYMDPQISSLLEVTYEAILDAGVDPDSIRGSNTGVFIGAQQSEIQNFWPRSTEGYLLPGTAISMFANRLSFCFDFKGPSNSIDTACSSSIYALNQALKSIRCGDCDAAIVGGAMLCLSPDVAIRFHGMGMLSPEGMCKSFDQEGNGYCRSEGISAMFVQKMADARRIYCTVVHSKVNADGHKAQGITFPSGDIQTRLLEATYREAAINPGDVVYIEAHGTGTPVGDPEEGRAITNVFCKDREGMASMAKVIIAMEENVIPANLHFKEPNEYIPGLFDGTLQVVDKNKQWNGGIVGLNSFGFGGANAHVILRSHTRDNHLHEGCDKPRLFVYGSRTLDGVESMLSLAHRYPHDMNLHKLLNETAFRSVDTHPYRGFTVLNSGQNKTDVQKASREKRPVWFVFSGMGSQWSGMGRKMMEIDVFRNSILKSDTILKQHGVRVYDIIMEEDDLSENVVKSFVGIISIQIALVDMLTCMGIKPDGLVGHSVGELGCGYADGSLTAEEAILAAYWRGHCVQTENLSPGGMAAVGLTWQEALDQCPQGVVPACHNSENSVTVSGPLDEVEKFVEVLEDRGTFASMVETAGVAFHSYFMQHVASSLKPVLDRVIKPKPRSSRWISSSYPKTEWATEAAKMSSSDYHVHNLLSPVLFHEALSDVPSNATMIEIAPHCLLQSVLKGSLGTDSCVVGLMRRNNPDNVDFCLTSLGKCFQNGLKFDPLKLFPHVEYPVPRGTPMISSAVKWDHSVTWDLAKSDTETEETTSFDIDLSKNSEYRYFLEHKIDGQPFFPGAGYLVLIWKALANREGKQWDQMPVMFESVMIHRATILKPDTQVHIDVSFTPGTDNFQMVESNEVVVSGKVNVPDSQSIMPYFSDDWEEVEERKKLNLDIDSESLYKYFRLNGFEYGPSFQLLLGASISGEHGLIKWEEDWILFIDTVTQLPILGISGIFLPTTIAMVVIDPNLHKERLKILEDGSLGAEVFIGLQECTRRSGGVHIHGVTIKQVRRLDQKPATHEAFKFIPYKYTVEMNTDNEAVFKYAEFCKIVLQICPKKGTRDIRLDEIDVNNNTNKESTISKADNLEIQNFADPKLHSFLQALREITFTDEEKSEKAVATVLNSKAGNLGSDILLGNLLQTTILKPCLDIIRENFISKSLRTIEISKGHWSNRLCEFLASLNQLRVSYTVATMDPNMDKLVSEEEHVKEVLIWEPGSDVSDNMSEYHLVIANNTIRKSRNVNEIIKSMFKILTEDGFMLIHEVTTNFYMMAPLDISDAKSQEYEDLDKRTSSIYCDAERWKQIFAEEGLEVIQEVSDNLLSSLFLLRKKATSPYEKQTVLDITDSSYAWVNSLKVILLDTMKELKGENLWVKADNVNGILGMVNCLRKEPGGEKIRCIFNMDGTADIVDSKTMEKLVSRDLVMNVYRDGQWGSYRHIPLDKVPLISTTHAYVNVQKRGDLSSLIWIQSPLMHYDEAMTADTDICNVHYASLNFRDVMIASGKLPVEAIRGLEHTMDCLIGMEFSGTDSRGRRVMGLVPYKGVATVVEANRRFLWEVPDDWSLEEAATVPVVYTTAFYALVVRGNIRRGNSILIHSGSGGVGQAAISIALQFGCKVFTTVGSAEKRDYLKKKFPQLKDRRFFSSRDTGFEMGILKATKGKDERALQNGVDIVLNSLAEEKLRASVRVLALHGKFLEIGKFDMAKNSALGMSTFLKNITFHGILLDALFDTEGQDMPMVSRCLTDGIKSGMVKPLKTTVFGVDDVEGAFRYMAKGKHIGKVLIQVRKDNQPARVPAFPRSSCHPKKTYIITGGLGGFGLELAHWLVDRGARHLVLTSRTGVKKGYQKLKLAYLKYRDAEITVSTRSISDKEEVRKLFKDVNGRPVGGIFHLAVVLKDALLENQTQETFQTICETKVTGTINLDQASREVCSDSLDWFVAFSSVSSGYGNAGQTNYGFGNSCMERIIEQRKKDGYPGLAIQWGPIGDVGLFIDTFGDKDVEMADYVPQRIMSCLHSLDLFLNQTEPVVCSYMRNDKSAAGSQISKEGLVQAICNILGIKNPESVDENRSFGDLGLDSLLGVEIKLTLENRYDIVLHPREIRGLTLKKLKALADGKEAIKSSETESNYVVAYHELTLLRKEFEILPTEAIGKLNAVEEGLPLFIIHHMFGTLNGLGHVISQLKVPVYGLQRTTNVPQESMQEMAAFYVKTITDFIPGRRFHLVGFSLGACLAQEMALQMQEEGLCGNMVSLTFLDGSHEWVHKILEQRKVEEEDNEMAFFRLLLGRVEETSKESEAEDILEEIASKLHLLRPDMTSDETKFLCRATFRNCLLAIGYHPSQKYEGNLTLIAAEQSTFIPSLSLDYGLSEYCSGEVTVKVVPGTHNSFLTKKSGEQVASILNSIIEPEK